MRKMVYRNPDGTVVNTYAEADAHARIELITITPPDEVEAKAKWDADHDARQARLRKKIAERG